MRSRLKGLALGAAVAGAVVAALGGCARASESDNFCYNGTSWKGCSTTNPLPTTLSSGSALIGATMTFKRYDATATVQNASYASGNSIGGLISFTLDRTASGLLQSVGLQFIGGATTAINGTCFDANPTGSTFTDKGTFTIAAADEAKRINKNLFQLTPVAQTGDSVTAASVDNYAQPFTSTGTIWCAFVSTGTFTPASTTDMRANVKIGQSAQ